MKIALQGSVAKYHHISERTTIGLPSNKKKTYQKYNRLSGLKIKF